jgi:hypothetical protein
MSDFAYGGQWQIIDRITEQELFLLAVSNEWKIVLVPQNFKNYTGICLFVVPVQKTSLVSMVLWRPKVRITRCNKMATNKRSLNVNPWMNRYRIETSNSLQKNISQHRCWRRKTIIFEFIWWQIPLNYKAQLNRKTRRFSLKPYHIS